MLTKVNRTEAQWCSNTAWFGFGPEKARAHHELNWGNSVGHGRRIWPHRLLHRTRQFSRFCCVCCMRVACSSVLELIITYVVNRLGEVVIEQLTDTSTTSTRGTVNQTADSGVMTTANWTELVHNLHTGTRSCAQKHLFRLLFFFINHHFFISHDDKMSWGKVLSVSLTKPFFPRFMSDCDALKLCDCVFPTTVHCMLTYKSSQHLEQEQNYAEIVLQH